LIKSRNSITFERCQIVRGDDVPWVEHATMTPAERAGIVRRADAASSLG
jgi:hypothetical protein